ncbi:patatin-like phospholipase family protein [Thioalkalivibrio sp. XN8]|uniref:patatin-like phospholipase family protein n=1 Tax=Thioalkalivibrio sp. XN8 TaxID=2712863 RepID=UPI0013EA1EC2|nr:patatin-like phospholipase family protein [Thioalkalivibrio sp. XN8]NGP52625.1 patatin-like phospholipase family protein [Thioalkalivibrio sp. XN8]
MAATALRILAGPTALQSLREEGYQPDGFSVMAGASGSAKWFAIGGLDRALVTYFTARRRSPLFLIGSSIGAWRSCCHALPDPLGALDRLEEAYLEQSYSADPTAAEVTATSRGILEQVLGPEGPRQILAHPLLRLNIVAVRARHLAASERPRVQQLGLGVAALGNLVSRGTLGLTFERVLFHDPRGLAPFADPGILPAALVPLTPDNLQPAVLASGAVPLVLEGVADIPGAAPGIYRDGGIVDYHFDSPLSGDDGLVLYPHFYPHLVPGWFDKLLPWRRAGGESLDRTVLLCPTEAFVAGLPGGKIPDRKDFAAFDTAERQRRWRLAIAAARRLGDEFAELVETGRLPDRAEPL